MRVLKLPLHLCARLLKLWSKPRDARVVEPPQADGDDGMAAEYTEGSKGPCGDKFSFTNLDSMTAEAASPLLLPKLCFKLGMKDSAGCEKPGPELIASELPSVLYDWPSVFAAGLGNSCPELKFLTTLACVARHFRVCISLLFEIGLIMLG